MCTSIRFSDNNGNMFFGRNLDWSVGYGQEVITTPRGYSLDYAFMGQILSEYALIGMGIVEKGSSAVF